MRVELMKKNNQYVDKQISHTNTSNVVCADKKYMKMKTCGAHYLAINIIDSKRKEKSFVTYILYQTLSYTLNS